MPFGEIFTGAFQRIWRHKNLWLLAMIGLALSGIGSLVSLLLTARWITSYTGFMNRMFSNPGAMPGQALGDLMNSMAPLWTVGACVSLLGLLGYVVNLIARSAIINEASYAWRGEATDTGRGLRHGAGRAVYVFLLDLIWLLPALLLGMAAAVAFFVLLGGTVAASEQNRAGAAIATSWIAFVCCGACLALLYYLVFSVFAPLMYQSAVAGRRDIGNAVSEGWRLARANLGAMIIFWLLLVLVGLVLGALQQMLNAIVSVPVMTNWFSVMSSMMQGFGRSAAPFPGVSGPLLALFGFASAILAFLIHSFTQTLNLTLYGGVYQHLAGEPPSMPEDPSAPTLAPPPAAPEEPAPATVEPPPALIVPPPDQPEELPPPTL